jgi:hypothetical protein
MTARGRPGAVMGTVARRSLLLASAVATAATCARSQPEPREGADNPLHHGALAFIARGDTTLRDDYVRADTVLRGTVRPLVRGAKFGWARYEVYFARTGEARRVVLSVGRVGTSPDSAPVSTNSTTLGPDFITEEWPNKPPTSVPYERGTVPVFAPSIAMLQELIRRARVLTDGKGTVEIPVYLLLTRSAVELVRVTWVAPNTAEVRWGGPLGVRYDVDDAGRILRGEERSRESITARLR